MDIAFWQAQWTAFVSAPVASLIFLAVGAGSGWWLANRFAQARLDGLRERVAVLEERLKLAAEQVDHSKREAEQLKDELEHLRARIAARASPQELETSTITAMNFIATLLERDRKASDALNLEIPIYVTNQDSWLRRLVSEEKKPGEKN